MEKNMNLSGKTRVAIRLRGYPCFTVLNVKSLNSSLEQVHQKLYQIIAKICMT